MMQYTKSHSSHAICVHCGAHIGAGEPCIRLQTIYFYNGCRSFFIHYQCVERFCKDLKAFRKENTVKWVMHRLGKTGDGQCLRRS